MGFNEGLTHEMTRTPLLPVKPSSSLRREAPGFPAQWGWKSLTRLHYQGAKCVSTPQTPTWGIEPHRAHQCRHARLASSGALTRLGFRYKLACNPEAYWTTDAIHCSKSTLPLNSGKTAAFRRTGLESNQPDHQTVHSPGQLGY